MARARDAQPPPSVGAVGVPGVPEVVPGDDLAGLLVRACENAGLELLDGDVVVVSSKVVSKAAGLVVRSPDAPAARRLRPFAAPAQPDVAVATRDAVVAAETVRVVASRRTPRGLAQVVESAAGPVMAAAGADTSNTQPGTTLVLPRDPDGAARALRARLRELGAPRIGVVVSDTAGRAWRVGQTDFALGCAGLRVLDDLRGTTDTAGTVLQVTERAVADEVAALADLVKGKVEGMPAAIVRGLSAFVLDDDGAGAAELLRDRGSDWFRLGHVEAVREALGVPADAVEPPSVTSEPLRHKVARAVEVAAAVAPRHQESLRCDVSGDGRAVVVVAPDGFTAGVVVTRLLAALWTEDLAGAVRYDVEHHTATVTVRDADVGDGLR
ncbi:MAG TPA: coenzyme F420-0:L-glutamate ligase [Actinomycetales bacterium]|nr:coenzyme F420-0:L-glutamate ligase [Actinomycetales bacterium]